MKVKEIDILCGLEGINIDNANVDIRVKTEEGSSFNLTCITPQNIQFLMDEEELDYTSPGHPFIIVKRITKRNIEKAIQAYVEAEDGYWLELYHFSAHIDRSVFEYIRAERIQKENKYMKLQKFGDLLLECKQLADSVQELADTLEELIKLEDD
jgi:hypothetical protein